MNHRAAVEGVPLVRPMYHLAPRRPARLRPCRTSSRFGSELLVAPITTPRDPRHAARRGARVAAAGRLDRRVHRRPSTTATARSSCTATARSIPALLRAGGILPLAAEDDLDATRNPERLELLVAPGADGAFTLIEDDGTGATPRGHPDRADDDRVATRTAGELTIGAADGPARRPAARTRTWTVTFLGVEHRGRETVADGPPDAAGRACAAASPTGPADAATAPTRCSTCSTPRSSATRPRRRRGGRSARSCRRHAMLAELHAQALPRELIGALSELLTARG